MKYIILLALFSVSTVFACSDKVQMAVKVLDQINFSTKESKVISHKRIGEIMIITGYLTKYETVIEGTQSHYQTYVFSDSCVIKEIIKVEPFVYND
ncbi:MAG: hypothetical protein N4A33_00575 [Bacteriovoracaceae bacterium]|nr:hypothetical protein [Bacteriovoracaceae bacterium]